MIPWREALARVAHDPHLCAFHAGGAGPALLAWGCEPEPLTDRGRFDLPGFSLVQIDYEWPAVAGRIWRPRAWLAWDGCGAGRAHGDAAVLERDLAGPARVLPSAPRLAGPLRWSWDGAGHAARVRWLQERIAEGAIYQANLGARLEARLVGADSDLGLFLTAVEASPASRACLLRAPGRSVVGHSPECFLRREGRRIASWPIKGTRRRVPGREAAVRAELASAPKDAAELAMIVDLVRNDLGRVAAAGSVQVADAGSLLDLPYVHHRQAVVAAELRPGLGLGDAVAAAFPAGSITGAPKLKAIELLRQVEAGPRGAWCGATGWIDGDRADLAVAIRTVEIQGDRLTLHAGGGIVADSDPAAEWDEAQAKAAGMLRLLGMP